MAKNPGEVRSLPGVRVPEVLLDVLEHSLSWPQIILVMLCSFGSSQSLDSTNGSPGNAIIDASTTSIKKDIECLLLAAFVTTKNFLVETTLSDAERRRAGLGNIVTGSDGQPREGAGGPDLQSVRPYWPWCCHCCPLDLEIATHV